jgi:hypothetical protein
MQKKIRRFSVRSRIYIRPRIAKHKKLQKFTISSYRTFCSLTGFLHVLPDFYILGAEKCGTTSLFDYLTEHPSGFYPISKEPRFFGKYYKRGLNWYRTGFPFKLQKFYANNINQKKFITGESTVRYLDNPHIPLRIKNVTPNANFIIMIRNPVDRAYSQYNMMLYDGVEKLSFEDALDKEEERTSEHFEKMKNDENYYSDDYFYFGYKHRGLYLDKIQTWMKYFPKEKFRIIKSEDFFSDPHKVFQNTLEFLNLPNYNLENYTTRGKIEYKQPSMLPETRKKLIDYFKPHNEKLSKFLNLELKWDK